jgi:hypothetical protein
MWLIALTCLLLIWTSAEASGAAVTVTSARDNTLLESPSGDLSNGAGPALFAGNNGQGLARRALLLFEVASQVPPGAAIDSVVMTLQVSNAPNDIEREFTLHRVLADWGEGTSTTTGGSGAPASEGDATWIHTLYPGQRWSTPGGEFDSAVSASFRVADVGVYALRGVGLRTDVQTWLARPGTNHGWLMVGEETGFNTARRFDSREATEPAARPTLTIYYTERFAARSTTWGSVKARYR